MRMESEATVCGIVWAATRQGKGKGKAEVPPTALWYLSEVCFDF